MYKLCTGTAGQSMGRGERGSSLQYSSSSLQMQSGANLISLLLLSIHVMSHTRALNGQEEEQWPVAIYLLPCLQLMGRSQQNPRELFVAPLLRNPALVQLFTNKQKTFYSPKTQHNISKSFIPVR